MNKSLLYTCSAMALLCGTGTAQAQQQQVPLDQATSTIGEIVVTARRREEALQSTPVAVSAFTAEGLEHRNVRSLQDLTATTPGLVFGYASNSNNTNISLRGQSKAATGNTQPAVVPYVNEVPLMTSGNNLPTFDLDSIQVLKGPQGTYFGRNTTGGAILITTRRPTYETNGYGSVIVGDHARQEIEGAVNIPLINDVAALRIAYNSRDRDGYTKNLNNPDVPLDLVDERAYRVSLLLEGFGIRNTTVYDEFRSRSRTAQLIYAALPGGAARTPSATPRTDCGVSPSCDVDLAVQQQQQLGIYVGRSDIIPRSFFLNRGVANTTTVNLPANITLKNIFGYRKIRGTSSANTDGTDLPIISANSSLEDKQYTDEIQVAGSLFDKRLEWLLGGFWLDAKPDGYDVVVRYTLVTPTAAPATNAAPYIYFHDVSKALFGQVIVNLSDVVQGLRVTGAYRKTWDKETGCSFTTTVSAPAVSYDQCRTLAGSFQGRVSSTSPSWSVGADWQITPKAFVYLTARRGYRSAGFNGLLLTGGLAPYQTFEPETLKDIEAGLKLDWDLSSVTGRLNLAAYRGTYTNIQSQIASVPANFAGSNISQGQTLTANFGKQTIRGIEADLTVLPTRYFTLNANTSYIDAKYDGYTPPPVFAPLLPAQPGIRNTPKFTFAASARYEIPLQGDGKLGLQMNYFHSSSIDYSSLHAPAYNLWNARVSWEDFRSMPIDLSVFVDNLTKEKYIASPGVSANTLSHLSAFWGAPRTIGAQVRYRFGD